MCKDSFDKFCWALLAVALSVLVAVLVLNGGRDNKSGSGPNKALEREMAYYARVELINKLYGPVDKLRSAGSNQEALLKLDELNRKYPGEAHGHILQGLILQNLGAPDEAIASFVEGIRLNGDYVDDKSPLSRRREIQRLVDTSAKDITARIAANPGNRTLAGQLQKINYLKSRLAGGCE
ncbi:hypothetical protein [Pelotalea chapellei]|uniref:Tetratricopeptide repeat protein n=1 Tax=Pelotalea chapellei TaxID=44671 RepID=A0ABS5UA13_9BACT|nr:hypothetical protein [Pelotalea chapellei]MBT1072521.1 hypothetical protein [Pelotalea chapellei]